MNINNLICVCFLSFLFSVTYCHKINKQAYLEYRKSVLERGLNPIDLECSKLYEVSSERQMVVCLEYYRNKGKDGHE